MLVAFPQGPLHCKSLRSSLPASTSAIMKTYHTVERIIRNSKKRARGDVSKRSNGNVQGQDLRTSVSQTKLNLIVTLRTSASEQRKESDVDREQLHLSKSERWPAGGQCEEAGGRRKREALRVVVKRPLVI